MSNSIGPCIYCDEPALPDTNPPVCEKHRHMHEQPADVNEDNKSEEHSEDASNN